MREPICGECDHRVIEHFARGCTNTRRCPCTLEPGDGYTYRMDTVGSELGYWQYDQNGWKALPRDSPKVPEVMRGFSIGLPQGDELVRVGSVHVREALVDDRRFVVCVEITSAQRHVLQINAINHPGCVVYIYTESVVWACVVHQWKEQRVGPLWLINLVADPVDRRPYSFTIIETDLEVPDLQLELEP